MCGISGILCTTSSDQSRLRKIVNSANVLAKRGPDAEGVFQQNGIAMGHRRLSIIDTSSAANQPMTDRSGRYTLIFNGEIYNFGVYRKLLEEEGIRFDTKSDTEVLLALYIKYGEECLQKLNGFFAFAVWDNQDKTLFVARDRMGIKPLYWTVQDQDFCFSSEMKGIMEMEIPKIIDRASLFSYIQLNYIPYPNTILEDVHKLNPGHFIFIDTKEKEWISNIEPTRYYEIPKSSFNTMDLNPSTYSNAQKTLISLLDESVKKRMISDVPLGAFLSGGIDSSVISTLASRHTDKLETFSIGFSDNPYYDETEYAELVAKKIKSNHHPFKLSSDDFYSNLDEFLDYIDEPFADSSAINVFILSKETKKHVTVALSGDGADEMFSGYNKHFAEYKVRNLGIKDRVALGSAPLLKVLPQSRDGKLGNLNRQIQRFREGVNLGPRDRYWRWASFRSEEQANYLLSEAKEENEQRLTDLAFTYKKRKEQYLKNISKDGDFNEVLYTDMQLVLPNDMLYKVDMMSMANSLEVRTPFLDTDVVDFAFQIPIEFKINSSTRKKILKDAFREHLPDELYDRGKKGFEVPLLNWLKNELKDKLENEYLQEEFIQAQGIFNYKAIEVELKNLQSKNPGDSAGTIWNLFIFQHWYKKYILN
ncbi:MAG: asparagine synthase (glutamine-hydrolyzing) [Crocinitomicaceae bacterium]|nr:asparagine synthase (glutamine-hydrolyzing) [Crocinitomicaceae bacterium]|tara:strand:- start:15831 stop:17774 length:1944 start_codon:yes stop_codon:yes gene_type:complete